MDRSSGDVGRDSLVREATRLDVECAQLRSRLRRRSADPQAIAWLHELEVAEARIERIRVLLSGPSGPPRRSWRLRRVRDVRRGPAEAAEDAIGLARAEAAFRTYGRLGGGLF